MHFTQRAWAISLSLAIAIIAVIFLFMENRIFGQTPSKSDYVVTYTASHHTKVERGVDTEIVVNISKWNKDQPTVIAFTTTTRKNPVTEIGSHSEYVNIDGTSMNIRAVNEAITHEYFALLPKGPVLAGFVGHSPDTITFDVITSAPVPTQDWRMLIVALKKSPSSQPVWYTKE